MKKNRKENEKDDPAKRSDPTKRRVVKRGEVANEETSRSDEDPRG